MKTKIRLGKKEVNIEVEKCLGLKKAIGLMFRRKAKANALLFEFNKPTKAAIHSLFCPEFIAVWLDYRGKIIDYKKISSNKLSIKPEKEFSKLLEIPLNNKYSTVVKFFPSTERFI